MALARLPLLAGVTEVAATIADYDISSASDAISIAEAKAAIDTAARFIDILARLLP